MSARPVVSAMDSSLQDRNRRIAIHHATLLQERKDMELDILTSIESLIDYPIATNSTSAYPAPIDISTFRTLSSLFSKSDLDALIQERNAAGRCGYIFCALSCKRDMTTKDAYFRLKHTKRDVTIVPRDEPQTWCSRDCAKRTTYIKTQLSDLAAWERSGTKGHNHIRIPGDMFDVQLVGRIHNLRLEDDNDENMAIAMSELALERNEIVDSARMKMVMTPDLREKQITTPIHFASSSYNHAAVEGHIPRVRYNTTVVTKEDEDDDWDLA